MSVRIVNNKHIDALVSYALDHGLLTYSELKGPTEAGLCLLIENVRSVNEYFLVNNAVPEYRFTEYSPKLDGVAALRAIDFLARQCSQVRIVSSLYLGFVEKIRQEAIREITDYGNINYEITS